MHPHYFNLVTFIVVCFGLELCRSVVLSYTTLHACTACFSSAFFQVIFSVLYYKRYMLTSDSCWETEITNLNFVINRYTIAICKFALVNSYLRTLNSYF
jgi:hypothetical protein